MPSLLANAKKAIPLGIEGNGLCIVTILAVEILRCLVACKAMVNVLSAQVLSGRYGL